MSVVVVVVTDLSSFFIISQVMGIFNFNFFSSFIIYLHGLICIHFLGGFRDLVTACLVCREEGGGGEETERRGGEERQKDRVLYLGGHAFCVVVVFVAGFAQGAKRTYAVSARSHPPPSHLSSPLPLPSILCCCNT